MPMKWISVFISFHSMRTTVATVLLESRIFPQHVSEVISRGVWHSNAVEHSLKMDNLLYPQISSNKYASMKERMHAVSEHPIYNFLHRYYRYSKTELKLYSPGFNCILESVASEDINTLLNGRFLTSVRQGFIYTYPSKVDSAELPSRYSVAQLTKNREILRATYFRQPFFGCFGLHEWAMVYRPNKNLVNQTTKNHQDLPFRISQSVINDVVESGSLKCSHFDAWRFFEATAQPLNSANPVITREDQVRLEQPGCIHANMDLFKYAYQLYPLLPATLLVEALELALAARRIDMRASPYDVRRFEGCEDTLFVETTEGRRQYSLEQEALARRAAPIRGKLLDAYDAVISSVDQAS